jgi:formylmethanofuran dehydrogenase subunit E
MARILILIILVWILYQIVKRLIASNQSESATKPVESFVQCAQCGCHVPLSESQMINNKIICNNPECIKNESVKK